MPNVDATPTTATNPDVVSTLPLALDAYLFCERLVEGFAADGPDLTETVHAFMDVLHRYLPLAARISLNRPGRRPGEKVALLPLSLRAAIREIADLTFPSPFVEATPFPELVRALAVEAFASAWEPGYAVRNIRRACRLLKQAGAISTDEPAVE